MAKDTRPMRKAVALRYNTAEDQAPVVVAKGQGRTAERIIEIAEKHLVPIHHDRNLVQILAALDLEQQIPPEAFQAVAAILAFLYQLNRPLQAK